MADNCSDSDSDLLAS